MICKRGVIYVTEICNHTCKFCYYHYQQRKKHSLLENLRQIVDRLKEVYGLTHVDITGVGEPTLYPHISEIVKYCSEKGIKPALITNGSRPEVVKRLIDEGYLEDVILSVHSVEDAYEELTGGSWKKLKETMEILKEGIQWRANVCVCKDNLPYLSDTIRITKEYGGRLMNFLVFNPHEGTDLSQKENETQATYTECATAIKPAIDLAEELGVLIEVRYIPLCTMKGYEKYVINFNQWIYDPYSWEEASGNGQPPFTEAEAKRFVRLKTLPNKGHCVKCSTCSNYPICDGVYPQYAKRYGRDEFEAYDGPLNNEAMIYRKVYMLEHPEAYSEDKW
jgi:MoaA/NifB/PqqE/SkfB family radical SAM enzyme